MSTALLQEIITRDRGADAYSEYASYRLTSSDVLVETAKRTLASVPSSFGSCVMISAGLVAALKSQCICAVVILGDLLINGKYVFQCRENLPSPTYEGEFVNATWDGHAWGIGRKPDLRPVDFQNGLHASAPKPPQVFYGSVW